MYKRNKSFFLKKAALLLALVMIWTGISIVPDLGVEASAAATDHPRRIVAYFCEWGDIPLMQNYTVDKIPWDKVTHINYAFTKVNPETNQIDFIDRTMAIEKQYQGQDINLPYKGHFNLLNAYKKRYPDVKTLVSVGGWTGTTGFYTMAETPTGRETFANSCVEFIRKYGFDGVDIDYEYPTSVPYAGNPGDSSVAEPRRASLYKNYVELIKLLRQKLDEAGVQDGRDYLLTAAVTASSWILGGMFVGEYAQYLDFANLMTYDFHGSWNGYVGHNSALWPDPRDPETALLGTPVLNIDWAYRYYRGVLSPDKINIGVPYYSRGWKNVTPSTYPGGLYGSAASQGGGAEGEFGIWSDPGQPSGTNPLWHVMNLLQKPENKRYWDDVTKCAYLWNDSQKVFLTIEDEESIKNKVQYIIDKGIGGMMLWELSGDYEMKADGTYGVGSTLTTLAYNMFKDAKPASPPAPPVLPSPQDFRSSFGGEYSHPNYTYSWTITNNTGKDIPHSWKLEFDMPKSCTVTSCWSGTVSGPIQSPYDPDFNRWTINGASYLPIPNGTSITFKGMINLCFSNGPKNIVLNGSSSIYEYNTFTPSYRYGDINMDDRIDSIDYTLMRRYLLSIIKEFPYKQHTGMELADVSGDGLVNSNDYTLMKRYLLGIITEFPAERSI
ncbi:MAG: glycosyl hydrolase family 18 protein [Bacillota bacterium]